MTYSKRRYSRETHMRNDLTRSITATALAVVVLAVGACVSMGTEFDPAQVALLQPGDTQEAVFARLGKPNTIVTTADGNLTMMWLYSQGNALGQGASRSVMLQFTSDGRLIRVVSQSATEIGMR